MFEPPASGLVDVEEADMSDSDTLVRKLAETRATLQKMVAQFGDAPSMQVPIERLRKQETELLEAIVKLMSDKS